MIAPADLPDHRGEGYYIYGLTEPDSEKVRYIGRTGNLAARYKAHCTAHGHTLPPNPALADWIETLAAEGKRPGITVIAHITGPYATRLVSLLETSTIKWWSWSRPGDLLQTRHVAPEARAQIA
jgi:hypothetical protein